MLAYAPVAGMGDKEWSDMTQLLRSSFYKFSGCAQCGKREVVLHKCSACGGGRYCGKE